MFDPEAAAGPSAGQLPSPSLAEQESRLEANNSVRRRIAESYPFSPQQQEHLGELGDLEDEARDPLLLKNKIYQPPARARPSLSRTSSLKSVYDSGKSGKLHAFYEYQNERIRDFLKPLVKHAQEAKDEQEAHRRPVQIAVYASLVFNSVLAILQLYSAIASLSLAFFASAIDAIFDPAVTILLWALTLKVKRADPQRYPAGGSRLLKYVQKNTLYLSLYCLTAPLQCRFSRLQSCHGS